MKLILAAAMAAMLTGCMTSRIEIIGDGNDINIDMSKTVSTEAGGNTANIPASLIP